MSAVVRWEEPAGPRRLNMRWRAVAEELRLRPGEWALILEDVDPREVNNGQSCLRAKGCEVRTRGMTQTQASLWARWPEVAS